MRVEDQTRRLTQIYLIVAWTAIVLISIVLGLIYRRVAVAGVAYETEGQAVALVQQFIAGFWPELRDFVREAPELGAEELREHPEAREANRVLLALGEDPTILKIRLYGASGLIVASTEVNEVGRYTSDSVMLEMATGLWWGRGRANADSRVARVETLETQTDTLQNVDLVITHVIIRPDVATPDRTNPSVLGIYQDVSTALRRIHTTQTLAMVSVIVVATLVAGIVWFRSRRTTD